LNQIPLISPSPSQASPRLSDSAFQRDSPSVPSVSSVVKPQKKPKKVQKKSRPMLLGSHGRDGGLYCFATGVRFCVSHFATRESGTGVAIQFPTRRVCVMTSLRSSGKLPLPFQNVPLPFRNSLCSATFLARSTQGCTCLFFSTGPDSLASLVAGLSSAPGPATLFCRRFPS
jgi:hypothetical protein